MARWKFMQIKPQKARGSLREEMWDDPNWVAEEKYDGDRRIAQFCGKVVRFTGCRESVDGSGFVEKTLNVPHLSGRAAPHKVPGLLAMIKDGRIRPVPAELDGTVLDGEMIFDGSQYGPTKGGGSKYVTSIMGSLPEEAVRKQIERGWLRYVVFDCLWAQGKDMRGQPLEVRQNAAYLAVKEWANPYVSMAQQWRHKKREAYLDIIGTGGEGVVLKHVDHTYGDERLWVKIKKEFTADVVIIGFEMAKALSIKKGDTRATRTKFDKMIGAVACGQHERKLYQEGRPLVEVATVSGMDDALRADITAHPKKYLGKVLRIKHNGREPTGRFRHPRWDGLRTDKAAKDCVFDLNEK